MEESEIPQKTPLDSRYAEVPASGESPVSDAFSAFLPEVQFRHLLDSHPIPDGVLDRVTQRILEEWRQIQSDSASSSVSTAWSGEVSPNAEKPVTLSDLPNTLDAKRTSPSRWGRRFFLVGASAAALGGILAWNRWFQQPQVSTRTIGPESLMMTGVSLFDAAVANRTWGTGTLIHEADQPMLANHSLWPRESFGPFPVVRQREEPNFLGRTAAAYDIRHYAALMGTLFAITEESLWDTCHESHEGVERFFVKGLGSRIPEHAMHPTAGRCASTWKETNRLFVLVVAGQPEDYRRFLTPPIIGTLG